MSYFRELPNILYQSNLSHKISSQEYIAIKNLFRRIKIRDDVSDQANFYKKYVILDGQRPDTVAEEFYGDAELDWVVLLTAGILNVRDEWPLSNYQLYRYAEEKHGTAINDIHHYETNEVKDSSGRIVLGSGLTVSSDFTFSYSDNGTRIELNSSSLTPLFRGISNWEYETLENKKKSSIYLLKKQYLQQFLNDMRDIMTYQKSSEYKNEKLIQTENTRNTIR